MKQVNILRNIVLFIAISAPGVALSAEQEYQTRVTRTLIDSVNYGQCMALTFPGPQGTGLNCGGGWVTFSCSGDFNSKSAGNLKLQSAMLSIVTGKNVAIVIDDTKKHNGYCFARRIDNIE